MAETWVCNASPIIALAKVGLLERAAALPARFIIPTAVAEEIQAGSVDDEARQRLEAGFGERIAASNIPPDVREWALGRGESAVLAVARQLENGVAVIDDAAARRCASAIGVPCIGTIGIIARL